MSLLLVAIDVSIVTGGIEMHPVGALPDFARVLATARGMDLDHDDRGDFLFVKDSDITLIEFWESEADDAFSFASSWELSDELAQFIVLAHGTGDLDDDGLSDLFVWTQVGNARRARLYESPTADSFPSVLTNIFPWTTNYYTGGDIADTDGDHYPEIVICGRETTTNTNAVGIYESTANNTYALHAFLPTSSEPRNCAVMNDLDDDGRIEILYYAGALRALENSGGSTYAEVWTQSLVYDGNPVNPSVLIGGEDLDGDGRREFLVGGLRTNSPFPYVFFLFESVGDNAIELVHTFTGPMGTSPIPQAAIADIDGDGRGEIVIGITPDVWIYKSVADNTWVEVWHSATLYSNAKMLGAGDHDGDGKAEVFFRDSPTGGTIYEIDAADAADLDLDGVVDAIDNCLATSNPGQEDADLDGVGDACDNCPQFANPAQGSTVFGPIVLASNAIEFAWSPAADVVWVSGGLGGLATYSTDDGGKLAQATTLAAPDAPPPDTGFYYLLRPDCPVGSWQTAPGGEPARDAALP